MTDLLSAHEVLESIAEEEIKPERLGSLIYWEISKGISKTFYEAEQIFAQTELHNYIQPVDFMEAIRRFADKAVFTHGNIYGKQLKFELESSKTFKGAVYVSFYTGNLDKKQSDFREHCKYIFTSGDDEKTIAVMNCDSQWLINTQKESSDLFFDECFLIINKDIQSALSNLANAIGYRFNKHGGHYFIAHAHTNDLYKIKSLLATPTLGQTLSIMPIVVCNDVESEEVIRIIGNELKAELEDCQRELFELCIPIYDFGVDWKIFSKAATENDMVALGKSRISKTKYGSTLYKRILNHSQNASTTEYADLVTKLLKNINPNATKSARKLYKIADRLEVAVKKLRESSGRSVILGKYSQKILADVIVVKNSIEKVSELLLNEVLELKF